MMNNNRVAHTRHHYVHACPPDSCTSIARAVPTHLPKPIKYPLSSPTHGPITPLGGQRMLIPRQLAQQRPPHLRGDLPLVLPRHVDRIVDVHPQLAPSVLDREESHGGEHRVGVRQTQRHDGHARLDREAEHPPLESHEPPVRTARALRERHYRHAILEVLPRALEHAELRSLVVAVDEEVFPLLIFSARR